MDSEQLALKQMERVSKLRTRLQMVNELNSALLLAECISQLKSVISSRTGHLVGAEQSSKTGDSITITNIMPYAPIINAKYHWREKALESTKDRIEKNIQEAVREAINE